MDNFLKSILDSSLNGIMTFKSVRDTGNQIVDFEWIFSNDVAGDIVGKKTEQLIGSRLLELLPGNKETGLFDRYCSVVETGEHISFEQHYPKDNIDKWFNISAAKLEDGFTVTFQDITELKLAQLELETRSEKYRKLFNESIDAIFLIDENMKFIDANASLLTLFNLKVKDLSDTSLQSIFTKDEDYSNFQRQLVKTGKIDELELYLQPKGGNKKFCLVNSIAVNDETETTYLGVIRDMTRRRQADKQLLMAEKLSMTGKIARTIGHEIRNPLTNLTLAIEQLKDEIEENEEAGVYVQIAQRNVKRISKLITDLLQSSKPKELKPTKQSLNNLIADALSLVQDRLKLQQIELREEYSDQVPKLFLDTDQFKIALLNLFINAIEAMKAGQGLLSIETSYENNVTTLTITDNGQGIPEENIDRLFEPYFTAKQEGTGLGLTTVQNIIQSHEGSIEVESEVGKGTRFIISLPV